MSKLLIELGPEESMDDWLDEIQWKRNHDCVAFENAIEECRALARQEVEAAVEAERARCLEIVEKVCAKAVDTQSDCAEEASHNFSRERYIHGRRLALELAEEIERQIRGGQ